MNKTQYTVYWTSNKKHAHSLRMDSLTDALAYTEKLRREAAENNYSFITMCSENVDQVGKLGATGVEKGKLPNGDAYTYTKGDALSQRTRKPAVGTDFIEVNIDDE